MLPLGDFRVKITECTEGTKRNAFIVKMQTEDRNTFSAVFMMNPAGLSELKRFAISAAGFGPSMAERDADPALARRKAAEGEAQYDALESSLGGSGILLDASLGDDPNAPSLVGRYVDVRVQHGKDVVDENSQPTGDFFRRYVWGAVG